MKGRDAALRRRIDSHALVGIFRRRLERELGAARRTLGDDAGPLVAEAAAAVPVLARVMASEVADAVAALVEPDIADAVLARPHVADFWPIRLTVRLTETDADAWAVLRARRQLPEGPAAGPDDALQAALWLHQRLPGDEPAVEVDRTIQIRGEAVRVRQLRPATWAEARRLTDERKLYVSVRGWPGYGLALLWAAREAIRAGSSRSALAVDAGSVPVGLVAGMMRVPKDPRRVGSAARRKIRPGPAGDDGIARIALLAPGQNAQLELPIAADGAIAPYVATAVRRILGSEGLRHWLGMVRLWSVEGGRSGRVRWTLDDHIAAVGLGSDAARRPEVRDEVRALVETLWQLELVTYERDGCVRTRDKLFTVWQRRETAAERNGWQLEGAIVQINPELWSGVRRRLRTGEPGKLGTNWWPTATELAQIDHRAFPYAAGLGFQISAWFRWAHGDGWPHGTGPGDEVLHRSARTLMSACGMTHDAGRPGRSWARLGRELDELVARDVLASWVWLDEPGLDAQIELRPAPWQIDRAVYGVRPVERPVVVGREVPTTGSELRVWRETKGWSLRRLAAEVGVTAPSVSRAEAGGDRKLGKRLAARVRAYAERA